MTEIEAVEATTAALAAIRANMPTCYPLTAFLEERLVRFVVHTTRTGNYRGAQQFRDYLWNAYGGGGTSAAVTHRVFRALGRGDECDPRWI